MRRGRKGLVWLRVFNGEVKALWSGMGGSQRGRGLGGGQGGMGREEVVRGGGIEWKGGPGAEEEVEEGH